MTARVRVLKKWERYGILVGPSFWVRARTLAGRIVQGPISATTWYETRVGSDLNLPLVREHGGWALPHFEVLP